LKGVVLELNNNSITTLTYEDFDWKKFMAELEKLGLETKKTEEIPCG